MRLSRIAVFAAAVCALLPSACAQRLSIGVIGGGSLTDSFPQTTIPANFGGFTGTREFSSSRDYLVGGTVELSLFPGWSAEIDGIYRKLHFVRAAVLPDGSLNSVSPSPIVTWEFPVLAKYRFQTGRLKPFLELGPSFRTAGNLNGTHPSHVGITSGAGLEVRAGSWNIAPLVRYTRWAGDSTFTGQAASNRNQVELLLGASRAAESDWHPLGGRLSAGVLLGVDITHPVRGQTLVFPEFTMASHPIRTLLSGPSAEIRIARGWSVEADAIYHRLRSETVNTTREVIGVQYQSGITTWDTPVLAKYRFIEAGPAFRLPAGGVSNFGVTAGAGVPFHLRRFGIEPMLRVTHWAQANVPGASGAVSNQFEFLTRLSL